MDADDAAGMRVCSAALDGIMRLILRIRMRKEKGLTAAIGRSPLPTSMDMADRGENTVSLRRHCFES